MAKVELIMPKMGESIMEATILNWVKKVGDEVEMDETILEIATDKVDSEIPSPVDGVISEILFDENETVEIGKVIAIITTEGEEAQSKPSPAVEQSSSNGNQPAPVEEKPSPEPTQQPQPAVAESSVSESGRETPAVEEARPSVTNRFYSPLVRNIAKKEGIGIQELETVNGTGKDGRVTKHDILAYLESRQQPPVPSPQASPTSSQPKKEPAKQPATPVKPSVSAAGNVEIIEMDRMRKMIADHMVRSKQTSPHVTSFVEADVTDIVEWRNRHKTEFQKKYGEKITYTPIFIEAVVKAIKDFPMINMSVDGDRLIVKKDINIGMAAALPSGNLIVPVIKGADNLNLAGITRTVNDLARRARDNKLKPEEIQGGTFTLTNVGTFGNVMGTPIINQPQVAILATGAIRKKPAVVETDHGDLIAIRHLMFLSLSYDHRVVDGYLGGSFLRSIGDHLESFDKEREI